MKDTIHNTINDMIFGSSILIDMIENAMLYTYSKKYEYCIEYFKFGYFDFEEILTTANIKFIITNDFRSFNLIEYGLKPGIEDCEICNTEQNAERFDHVMLFMYNRQLKRQTLIDFI